MILRDHVSQTIGKKISSIVTYVDDQRRTRPYYSLRFVFNDATYFEIWGDDVHANKGLDRGDADIAAQRLADLPGKTTIFKTNPNHDAHSIKSIDNALLRLTSANAKSQHFWTSSDIGLGISVTLMIAGIALSSVLSAFFAGSGVMGLILYFIQKRSENRHKQIKEEIKNNLEDSGLQVEFDLSGIPVTTNRSRRAE